MPEAATQYDYEWMDALSQAGNLFDDLFPVLKEYGLVPVNDTGPMPQPQPAIVVQPSPEVVAPKWYDQIPPWGWGLIGLGGGALVFALLRR
ncbi:hypothetical protein [Oceanithermus sp.]